MKVCSGATPTAGPPACRDFVKTDSTRCVESSLETKLSDGKRPLGSENSVTNCQNASSVSCAGSSAADHTRVKEKQRARTISRRIRYLELNTCDLRKTGNKTSENCTLNSEYLESIECS